MFKQLTFQTWAPIPLRLIVGLGFMQHGYAKLLKGPEAFASILHLMRVPAPHMMAWLTIVTELVGGVRCSAWRVRFCGQHADGDCLTDRHVYRALEVRI